MYLYECLWQKLLRISLYVDILSATAGSVVVRARIRVGLGAAAAGILTVHTAPGGRRPRSAARPLGDFSNGIHE